LRKENEQGGVPVMLQAVIFDMDGVIVDSEPYHYEVESMIFDRLGISIPDEERHTFIGKASDKLWSHIRKAYQLNQSVNELLQFDRSVRLDYMASREEIAAIPGVVDLLNDLTEHEVKIALASSSSIDLIALFIEKLKLGSYFSIIISGDFVERGKPDPDIFTYTAQQLKEDTSKCIVIEDSTNGIRAAKAAGMACIGFRNPNSKGQDLSGADHIIDDLRKLNYDTLKKIHASATAP
jgi:HAD superfamily hydrolase (TIGR01509 family)